MKKFGAENVTIAELMQSKFYKLHIGQRRYEWDEELIEQFITDISTNTENKKNYFIGTSIFVECNEKSNDGSEMKILSIIDGQQRITTISLIISAMKEKFEEYDKNEKDEVKKSSYSKYITILSNLLTYNILSDEGNISERLRLQVSKNDENIFYKLINNKKIDEDEILTRSHENLINGKVHIKEIFEAYTPEEIIKFMSAFLQRVEIVEMKTDEVSTAYTLFENVNERLRSLEPSDLIKNMFFRNISEAEHDKLSEKWDNFINKLTPSKNNKIKNVSGITPSNFFKHYIMSKGKYISKDGIYDYFYDLDLKEESVIEVLDELNNKSNLYIEFLQGKGNEYIYNIKMLGLKQSIIVLLKASELQEEKFKEFCELLEKIAFCYMIGKLRTNTLERSFTDICKAIDKKELYKAKCILDNLINKDKDKVLFELKNMIFNTRSKKVKLKYILLKIAKLLDGGDYKDLELEHIMPEDKSNDWNDLIGNEWYDDEELYNHTVSLIGNFGLLTKSDNASIKGKKFNEKCKVYNGYPNRLTSSITTTIDTSTTNTKYDKLLRSCPYTISSKWDKDEIIKRSEWMCNLTEYIWFNKEIK